MDPLRIKPQEMDKKNSTEEISKNVELVQKLEALDNENRQLRSKLYDLQFRGSFPLSIIILSIGGVALLAAYAYDSMILTFIGLGLILWGGVIFYTLPRKVIPEESMLSTVSITNSLSNVIQDLGYNGHAIFLYPNTLSGLANGYMFIPTDNLELPSEEELIKEKSILKNGLLIPAHAQSMIRLLEDELNTNLLMLDLAEVQRKIEQFFVEDLKIVDSINFNTKDDIIEVSMNGSNAAYICRSVNIFDKNHIGCILCSSIALMISKVTGIPVVIDNSIATSERIHTTYRLLNSDV